MKSIRWLPLLIGSLLIPLCTHSAQDAPPEMTGLEVGKKAPAFALPDQNGVEVTLDSLLEKGPVALVFYRSADW